MDISCYELFNGMLQIFLFFFLFFFCYKYICNSIRDLPGKIFGVSKASLVLIETGPFAKIWGHFFFVMFKEN